MEAFVLSCGSRGTGKIYLVESVYVSFIFTDVCVHMCAIYMWKKYTHAHMNMHREGWGSCWMPPSIALPMFTYGLSLNLGLVILSRWVSQWDPACPPVSAHPVLGYSWWRVWISTLVHMLGEQALCPPSRLQTPICVASDRDTLYHRYQSFSLFFSPHLDACSFYSLDCFSRRMLRPHLACCVFSL